MPLGGIAIALFVGYIMDKEQVKNALKPYMGEILFACWLFVLRYLTPIFIFALMLKEIGILNWQLAAHCWQRKKCLCLEK